MPRRLHRKLPCHNRRRQDDLYTVQLHDLRRLDSYAWFSYVAVCSDTDDVDSAVDQLEAWAETQYTAEQLADEMPYVRESLPHTKQLEDQGMHRHARRNHLQPAN